MRLPYWLRPCYLGAVLRCWGYVVRPFDPLADRRYWFWQRPTPCSYATGGRIEPFNRGETATVVLSPGVGVVSRAQADAVGLPFLRMVDGAPRDIVIVEPDGTLTEVPHDAEAT